jgi:uncharacterized protein
VRIAIVGATGFVGERLVQEALRRGHEVTAITRSPGKLPKESRLRPVSADVNDVPALTDAFKGQDAVIHAYAPPRSDSTDARIEQQRKGTKSIIAALKAASVKRFLAVGGAGTSEIAPGVALMDSYLFPKAYEGGARSTAVIKELLKEEPDLDWAYLCPPHFLESGERTGRYRLGQDNLIIELETGRSHISTADYAVAMIDELETPKHSHQRFTVGT